MAARCELGNLSGTGTPTSMPEGTPSMASPTDHSWTLQAVMDLHRSVGTMSAKLDAVTTEISAIGSKMDALGDKLDKARHWQSVVTGGAIVVGALAAFVWSVITFVPWDRVHFDSAPSQDTGKTITPAK